MSVLIKGLNIKPCKDGFDGKGLVLIIGYDDKVHLVAHEQIIPLPDHGDLIDRDALLDSSPVFVTASFGVSEEFISRYKVVTAHVIIPAERSE